MGFGRILLPTARYLAACTVGYKMDETDFEGSRQSFFGMMGMVGDGLVHRILSRTSFWSPFIKFDLRTRNAAGSKWGFPAGFFCMDY